MKNNQSAKNFAQMLQCTLVFLQCTYKVVGSNTAYCSPILGVSSLRLGPRLRGPFFLDTRKELKDGWLFSGEGGKLPWNLHQTRHNGTQTPRN